MEKETINLLLSKGGTVTIRFTGTDAIISVYEEDGEYKVAYTPLPDCDRTPDMYEKDIRFTIEKTDVKQYIEKRGDVQ